MPDYRTVTIPERGEHILLCRLRGISTGFLNGFGGNQEPQDKTLEDTSKRGTWEQSGGKLGILGVGIQVLVQEEIGVMLFKFTHKTGEHEVHFYKATRWRGRVHETDEMVPHWFLKSEPPLDGMFPGDRLWFPLYQQGKYFNGWVLYDERFAIVNREIK